MKRILYHRNVFENTWDFLLYWFGLTSLRCIQPTYTFSTPLFCRLNTEKEVGSDWCMMYVLDYMICVDLNGVSFFWAFRCYLLDGISKGAWLNRSSIIFAGNDKWSVDPRVSIVSNMGDKHEYSLQIQKVDVTDEGFYTCSIQSERNPRPKLIQLIVKGKSPDLLRLKLTKV